MPCIAGSRFLYFHPWYGTFYRFLDVSAGERQEKHPLGERDGDGKEARSKEKSREGLASASLLVQIKPSGSSPISTPDTLASIQTHHRPIRFSQGYERKGNSRAIARRSYSSISI